MRIERVSNNQFTIFLTFDDLVERGFTKDDLWHDAIYVQNLFTDMMYEASSELGFELEGELLIQVHLMQAQGMRIMVTQKMASTGLDDDFIEMKVTLDESKELIFAFDEFEDIIQVTSYLAALGINGGQVYYMDNRYYMLLNEKEFSVKDKENIIAIMSEFSSPTIITSYRLNDYGKMVFQDKAVQQIQTFFYT